MCIGAVMRRSLLIGLAVLVVLVSVIQGTAMQKQTTIPGLLFPSTTPTLTHTPTITLTPTMTLTPTSTNTPTASKTPTKTVTVTPDPSALVCALLLQDFATLHASVNPAITQAMDSKTLKTTADFLRAGNLLAKYIDKFSEQYDPSLGECVSSTRVLHEKNIELMQVVASIDFATSMLDMSLLQSLTEVFVRVSNERSVAYRRVIDEYRLLKNRYPSVIWPELLP
jgi:hypothetical protein